MKQITMALLLGAGASVASAGSGMARAIVASVPVTAMLMVEDLLIKMNTPGKLSNHQIG